MPKSNSRNKKKKILNLKADFSLMTTFLDFFREVYLVKYISLEC